ncbi:hypothetical protein GCG54_00013911 [Colletotrichum gloeosporioides]|uniref:Secreted protein n=1 Tax=Colletotrichum gloeosporioides TaxID=474922 RepID=A0A8H4CFF3_COLGL|nr:uncharacterized protein GCG54_00013911 [Colletotrichum gloeosporioides]KAF3802677.1 hypothetical protein GCG54_00013911 [Colletotrichum gloeosporioides]
MILLPLFLALAATTASAARIRSLTHSGPGCPQDAKVTWSGDLSDLTITLSDFSESLAAGQMTSCQVHLLVDQGESRKSLVLQDVVVRGGLYLSPNSKVDFYTTAYWSEAASDTVTKQTSTFAGSSAVVRNVAIAQRLGSASPCVGIDGYVGILNVTFRIIAQEGGRVVFGRERVSSTSPVTEALSFAWQSC